MNTDVPAIAATSGGRSLSTRRLSVPFLVLTLLASMVAVLARSDPAYANDYYSSITTASPENENWMSRVPDDASLADLSIPGTHDSLALCGYSPPRDGSDCDLLTTGITQTQEHYGYSAQTLAVQLEAGIRAIDIRVRVDKGDAGLTFTVHHGVYYQWANFTDVLTKIEAFLDDNPSETILLHLKAECEDAGLTTCSDADGYGTTEWRRKVFDSYLTGRVHTGDGDETTSGKAWRDLFWSPSVDGGTQASTPNLGDVRGKVVLLGFRGPRGGIYDGYGIGQLYPAGGSADEYVQDNYEVPTISGINERWEDVRTHLRKTNGVWDANRGEQTRHTHKPDALYVNYTSGTGAGANPYTVAGGTPTATGVNQFLIQCLRGSDGRCPEFYPDRSDNFGGRTTMDRTGIVMMDFPGGGLIDEILERNPSGQSIYVNGGAGDPMEQHPGGDDGGPRPAMRAEHAQCRPDGLVPTAGTNTPYCADYQTDGREWLGNDRERRVIGYFNGARTGADGKPYYLVKNIPWSKVTHLNYAFAHVEANRISVGADGPDNPATGMTWNSPGAEPDTSLPYRGHFNQLTKYKKLHPRVKTLISVGGWAETTGFYTMTTNADGSTNQSGINTFADSVVEFLDRYGFDGVDIDYEYPTVLDDTGNPNDWAVARPRRKGLPASYTALMKTLREKLDRAAAAKGDRYYLLTSASSASGYLVRGMENQKALRYQDYTNLMAYDYHGSWNDVVGPNAALYDDGKDPELAELYGTPEYQKIGYFNTDWAFHHLRGALQAGRINIGIPYYTRGWRDVTGGESGLWGNSAGTDCQPGTGLVRPCGNGAVGIDNIWHDLSADGGEVGAGVSPMWHARNLEHNIMPRYAKNVGLSPDTPADRLTGTYALKWNEATRTSSLWNADKKTYLSIQDTRSLDEIIDYVDASGAGGVMMWELSGDYECPPSAELTARNPCVMGYTLTQRLHERLQGFDAYDNSRSAGSTATPPSSAIDVSVDLVQYPNETAKLWPLTPTVRISNNTGVTLGGGKDNVISFDLPTSTPALIKDGDWQTGEQGGRWKVRAGHTGPNAGSGLAGDFHRVSLTLDYCQIIPAGKSLDVPIIYYIPATGPVNTTVKVGGTTYAPTTDHNRGAVKTTPAGGGCSAAAWSSTKVYDPSTQSVENVTVKYDGKIWRAKWWTQGNVPGTGADPDHEPWRYVGPAS